MIQNQSVAVDFNTAATQTLVAAVPMKRIVVFGFLLVNGVLTGQSVQFKSGSNNLTGVMALPSSIGGGLSVESAADTMGLFMTDQGVALTMAQSAATQLGGYLYFKYA